jgi:hypothetical protein
MNQQNGRRQTVEFALRDCLPYNCNSWNRPVFRRHGQKAELQCRSIATIPTSPRKSAGNRLRGAPGIHANTIVPDRPLLSNSGIPLDLNWVQEVRVNTSAVERRAQTQVARRTVKKEWQAAWLLRAITCMDLTTLSGDDTDERVRRLCAKARQPIQQDLVQKLGIEELA